MPSTLPRVFRILAHRTRSSVRLRMPSRATSINTPSPGVPNRSEMLSQRNINGWYGIDYDPEREITVCCGATEGMIAALLAVTNPGDELIIFEPYYENYRPDAFLCEGERKFVKLRPPDWRFDPDE